MDNVSRRDLLKLAGLTSLGASLGRAQTSDSKSVADMPFQPKETIRIGVIGTGGGGNSLGGNFSEVPGAQGGGGSWTGRARPRSPSRCFIPTTTRSKAC